MILNLYQRFDLGHIKLCILFMLQHRIKVICQVNFWQLLGKSLWIKLINIARFKLKLIVHEAILLEYHISIEVIKWENKALILHQVILWNNILLRIHFGMVIQVLENRVNNFNLIVIVDVVLCWVIVEVEVVPAVELFLIGVDYFH